MGGYRGMSGYWNKYGTMFAYITGLLQYSHMCICTILQESPNSKKQESYQGGK